MKADIIAYIAMGTLGLLIAVLITTIIIIATKKENILHKSIFCNDTRTPSMDNTQITTIEYNKIGL